MFGILCDYASCTTTGRPGSDGIRIYIYIVLNSCASEKDRQIPVAHMLVCAVCHRSRQTAQIIKPENNKMFIIMFMHEIQPCTHPSDSKSTPLRRIMTMQPEITQANAKQQTKILKIKKNKHTANIGETEREMSINLHRLAPTDIFKRDQKKKHQQQPNASTDIK